MRSLDLRLGDVKLALPADWEQEISVVSRAPAAAGGHRPNVRITYRTASEPVSLERLAEAYQSRLAEGLRAEGQPAGVTVVRQTKRVRGGQELIELVLAIELSPTAAVHHQAIIAIRDRVAITVAASRPAELPDTDVVDALTHALASVGFGR